MAKDMGVKVEYTDMDFDGLLGALQANSRYSFIGMTQMKKEEKCRLF